MKIYGNWEEGYVLDYHTLSSEFIGYNASGKPKFDAVRTELGELVYQIKYRGKKEKLNELLSIIKSFLDGWNIKNKIDLILPVPPSNHDRIYQPVFELANLVGNYLDKPVDNTALIKKHEFTSQRWAY
jgi:predicted amidophosphoribosyltransferase